MRKFMLLIVFVGIIVVVSIWYTGFVMAVASCTQTVTLNMSRNMIDSTGQGRAGGATCFVLQNFNGSAEQVLIDVNPLDTSVNLYWAQGNVSSFSNNQRQNLRPYDSRRTIGKPIAADLAYTFAVEYVADGSVSITVRQKLGSVVSNASDLAGVNPLGQPTPPPEGVEAPLEDRISLNDAGNTYPLEITCPGTLAAFVDNGIPEDTFRIELENSNGIVAEVEGSGPLYLNYDIGTEEIAENSIWELRFIHTFSSSNFFRSEAVTAFSLPESDCLPDSVAQCPGTLPSRLEAGDSAVVIDNGIANNVRNQPSRSARRVGQIPSGGTFTVLEGPVCADNYAWYRVRWVGGTGWTAEAGSDEYWLKKNR